MHTQTSRIYIELNGQAQTGKRFIDLYDGEPTSADIDSLLSLGLSRAPTHTEVTLGLYDMVDTGEAVEFVRKATVK